MIISLSGSAQFASSGASLTWIFQPENGITAVVGRNGTGKTTTTIECARYLLFGKAALRGVASDYKNYEATGSFRIRDQVVKITRAPRGEKICDADGEVMAVGADAVSKKVIELLGYGLEVFDLCNAATQGNVQALGRLRPAERKKLVDSVLGITDTLAAEKDCRNEANGHKRDMDTYAKMLRAPGDEPPRPAGRAHSLQTAIMYAREQRRQLAALQARRREVARPVPPVEPRPTSEQVAALEREVDAARELHARHRNLHVQAMAGRWSAEQLDAAEKRAVALRVITNRGPKPTLSPQQIAEGWAEVEASERYRASEQVTCPECGTTFRPTGEPPAEPRWSRAYLRAQERATEAWPDEGPEVPDGPDLAPVEILRAREALSAAAELAAMPPLPADRSGELANLRRLYHHWEALDQNLRDADAAEQENAEVDVAIAAMGEVTTQEAIDQMADDLNAEQLATAAWDLWKAADDAYKTTAAKLAEAKRLMEAYKAGADGLVDARTTLKQLLAPRISSIASALIRDMTMGELTSITVDEDMDILVGNQRLETLSGAGLTVANLALRVAMGQALVGKSFSAFLADEIDGDLDGPRRAATLQAMVSLKKHVDQIILVTHRGAEIADHVHSTGSFDA